MTLLANPAWTALVGQADSRRTSISAPTLPPSVEPMKAGEEMMVWCEGGRSMIKREVFPPRLEIPDDGGMYVLNDQGDPADWRYVFIASKGQM